MSLVNQNRLRHLSFSQLADDQEVKDKKDKQGLAFCFSVVSGLFFFVLKTFSYVRHVYHAHPAGDKDQKFKGAVCDFGWDVAHR